MNIHTPWKCKVSFTYVILTVKKDLKRLTLSTFLPNDAVSRQSPNPQHLPTPSREPRWQSRSGNKAKPSPPCLTSGAGGAKAATRRSRVLPHLVSPKPRTPTFSSRAGEARAATRRSQLDQATPAKPKLQRGGAESPNLSRSGDEAQPSRAAGELRPAHAPDQPRRRGPGESRARPWTAAPTRACPRRDRRNSGPQSARRRPTPCPLRSASISYPRTNPP